METLGTKLRLAYYEASDGPRVIFYGPLDAAFQGLVEAFEELSKGKGPLELDALEFVRAFGVRVFAESVGSIGASPVGKPQGIRRRLREGGIVFEWKRTAEGWDYLARLLEPLVETRAPGHQYLTSYPEEDAIVVVSKGEYGDELLSGDSTPEIDHGN
jgi:hypothetical protein